MSRAFGDTIASSVGVICTPDVSFYQLTQRDSFLLVCSDGVTELLSSQQVVHTIDSCRDKQTQAANILVEEATRQWKLEESVIGMIQLV